MLLRITPLNPVVFSSAAVPAVSGIACVEIVFCVLMSGGYFSAPASLRPPRAGPHLNSTEAGREKRTAGPSSSSSSTSSSSSQED